MKASKGEIGPDIESRSSSGLAPAPTRALKTSLDWLRAGLISYFVFLGAVALFSLVRYQLFAISFESLFGETKIATISSFGRDLFVTTIPNDTLFLVYITLDLFFTISLAVLVFQLVSYLIKRFTGLIVDSEMAFFLALSAGLAVFLIAVVAAIIDGSQAGITFPGTGLTLALVLIGSSYFFVSERRSEKQQISKK